MFCQYLNFLQNIFEVGFSGEFVRGKLPTIRNFENLGPLNLFQFMELLSELDYSQYLRIKEQLCLRQSAMPDFEKQWHRLNSSLTPFISPVNPDFPDSFFDLAACPFGIYVTGDISLLRRTVVAMVGSRKATYFALKEAEYIGQHLASSGIAVVSGGALGCDIASHIGVLKSKQDPCPAIVVFASGLEKLYPQQNRDVFSALTKKRALFVSEKPPHFPSLPRDFPRRNRLIVALAKEVVVVQCGLKSGAMNSVYHALESGKDVHVLRQKNDIRADGCEKLIADGVSHFASGREYIEGVM